MTEKELNIVGHSLGIDVYSLKRTRLPDRILLPDDFYRNYYVIGKSNPTKEILDKLVSAGLMIQGEKFGDLVYIVTESGKIEFRKQYKAEVLDKFKPPRKSERNYLEFLSRDGDQTFAEFLGISPPRIEYGRGVDGMFGAVRMVSTKYPDLRGDWKFTKKEAKASYKEKLKSFRNVG
jgi:hypothetical protein